jgi:hypothetical protein
MHQPLQYRIKLSLGFLIFNLLAQYRSEPGNFWQELDQPDAELIFKTEGQNEDSPGVDGVLL